MQRVPQPTQIGVKLPYALRTWVEAQANEAGVATSTLIRKWIAERAQQDLGQRLKEELAPLTEARP